MEAAVTQQPAKRQSKRTPGKSVKERVESNPFVYIITVAIAVAGLVAGVHQFFASQASKELESKYQAEVRELQTRMASINRGTGEKSDFLDVKTFLRPKSGGAPIVSPTARFFPDDDFYASTTGTYWTYSKTTEGALMESATGKALPQGFAGAAFAAPLHLWKGEGQFAVDGSPFIRSAFPHITLQRFPIDEFAKIMSLVRTESAGQQLPEEDDDREAFLQATDRLFHGDVVGVLLAGYMNIQMSVPMQDKRSTFELMSVQKVGNVLYAKSMTTLKDVSVDRQSGSRLYLTRELIVVSNVTDVYFISVFVPGREPAQRGEPFTKVTEWLGDLAILIG
jgi:hypothetical protein